MQQSGAAVARSADERLAASYVNFLITNGAVIMPAFGLPEADTRWGDCLRIFGLEIFVWCSLVRVVECFRIRA